MARNHRLRKDDEASRNISSFGQADLANCYWARVRCRVRDVEIHSLLSQRGCDKIWHRYKHQAPFTQWPTALSLMQSLTRGLGALAGKKYYPSVASLPSA